MSFNFDPERAQQARKELKGKCIAIAADAISEVERHYGVEREGVPPCLVPIVAVINRTSISGKAAFRMTFNSACKIIRTQPEVHAPHPYTRRALSVFLHECAHHLLGHVAENYGKPLYGGKKAERSLRHEHEANEWSIKKMREHGIAVPRLSIVQDNYNYAMYERRIKRAKNGRRKP